MISASDSILLGLIQGATEFLPISSSGHLVIAKHLLGIETYGVTLEVWLHAGTLLAVLVYYWRRIIGLACCFFTPIENETYRNRTLLWALIIGTLPAVIIGLLFKSFIEETFGSPQFTAAMLVVTGLILLTTCRAKSRGVVIGAKPGLYVGLAQALAILPGISRSGSTISTALWLGAEPVAAAEFSFLLSIPAIGGAFLLDLFDVGQGFFSSPEVPYYLLGAAVSFICGLLAIHYLLKILTKGKFFIFGFYCLVIGLVALVYLC